MRIERRQLFAREHLPTALVIEVSADRRDHSILEKQCADRVEPLPVLLLERQQVAHLVVAIRDVDAHVAVVDVVAREPKLARIGMHELDTAPRAVVLHEMRLLVGTVGHVLRLDEGEIAPAATDGPRMVEQHLQEQVALIARGIDREQRIVARERRHDVAHHERLGERAQMDAAHARQARLHDFSGTAARARKIETASKRP